MYVDFEGIGARDRYKLLVGTVVPRPIALVTTRDRNGVTNAAPFSFFNIFSEDPALAILGLESRRSDGALKDTTRNIEATGELVINLVDRAMAGAMAACAAELESHEDELAFADLTSTPSVRVSAPGIAEAPIRLECRLFELRRLTPCRHLCIAEVIGLHARDGLVDPESFHADARKYQPIGRLFGDLYTEVTEIFDLKVPRPPTAPKERL